jgi:hypothetical protein
MIYQAKTHFKSYEELHAADCVVTLSTPTGLIPIYKCADSGRIVTRKKIDTLTDVYHPGIILGKDKSDRIWVAHNHYKHKKPTVELYDDYLKGQKPLWDNRAVDFSREEIVQRAVREIVLGKTYDKLRYNCQTFINLVVIDTNKSEAVDKLSDAAMTFGGILTVLGLLAGNKTAVSTGATIFAVGGGAKVYSRVRK